MGFGAAIAAGFANYAEFGGRASRPEFWWWQLFVAIASLAATAVVASRRLAGLRHLDLSRNDVRDQGAAAVAEAPHLANLESLEENASG